MTETAFKPGETVVTPREPGTIIDVRATPSGRWVYGVEHDSGEVGYFTGRALQRVQH
ncbi:hypothetical protein [Microbacterium gallinarum]|uniref:SH3 domain-containing protein n=1 Tax=Microbacterium gallinarum TaxID=2762209 RepID=A0ABR8X3A1_9MICO|nr:hypothetical protein [Microbacterium gallinarum]MBD8023316.1 hypothetical protein [Microbacterium gallinarum]